MFEGVVSYLINRFLGKYVQGLDSSNLRVGIFSGDVELKDLQLRTEALVELNLPIEVKAGYIGYMKVDIPWTSLFSCSVTVLVEDVYVLAGPVTDRGYDLARETALQNAVKREILLSLTPTGTPAAPTNGEDPGFLEKLYTYVLNNIQVSVGRIHVRYEDTVTNPDHPFACGVMLKHISAYTTDMHWQPAQMDNAATVIHKLLEMRELSVYWNTYIPEQHLIRSKTHTDAWRSLLKQAILQHRILEEDFDFIVEPITAEVKVIINKDNNQAIPKMLADVCLDDIEVLLSRQQFLNILNLSDSFKLMSVNQKYRRYHPNVPLKISPRSWWVYAFTAIVEERIRPFSFERIKQHRIKYNEYKDLYIKHLCEPDDEDIKERLAVLEEGLNVTNIVMAREHAKESYAPHKVVKKPKKKTGWFSWWGGEEEEEEVKFDLGSSETDWFSKLTPEEKTKLYQGIGYDKNASVKKSNEYKLQLNMKSCCVSLVNYSKKILQVCVTQMLASFETRPGKDAYRLSCNTESFVIEGASIEHELIPIVTSDVNVYAPSVNQVFTLDFESRPVYVEADFSLKMNIQPVEVVYDEHSLCEVRAFFQLPTRSFDMRAVAMETMQGMASISQAGLIYAIQTHKTIHLAVNMKSPYIVVPEFGTLHRGGNVLIVDLGMLQVKSELQPKNTALEQGNLSQSEIAASLYDQFTVSITDVKVLLADSGDDWHTAQVQPTSEYHILPSMKLNLDFYNSVKQDYKQLPQQKVITTLPTFEINISDRKLLFLWKFYNNFTVTSSASMHHLGEDMVDAAMATGKYDLEELIIPKIDPSELQLEPDLHSLRTVQQSILGRRVINRTRRQPKMPTKPVSGDLDLPAADDPEEANSWIHKYDEVKPVDDISSTKNTTNIVVRLIVREVVIQLSQADGKDERPYLMFRADRLRLDAVKTKHGVAAHASLGAIQLVDKIHVGALGQYLELMSTKPGTDLVSVLYRQVEATCPDFVSVYNGVKQGVKVQFETLNILVDQSAVTHLRAYIEGLQTSMQTADMMRSSSTMGSTTVTTAEVTTAAEVTTETVPEGEPVGSIQWNILFDLHDVSVVLADNGVKRAEIHVKDLRGHAVQWREQLVLVGSLKDIDIKDCTQGALYPNILMLEDKEGSLFAFSFVHHRHHKDEVAVDNRHVSHPTFHYMLNMRVGHVQMVLLGRFYWEIMKFMEPLLSPGVKDTAAFALKSVSKQVGTFHEDNKRFGIHIIMVTPTILIPVRSDSLDLLLLKSGDLSVSNKYNTTEVMPGLRQEWNHLFISLEEVQLSRARLSKADDAFMILSHILEPMAFQTDVRLAMDPIVSDMQTDINCSLDKLQCAMSVVDAQVSMAIMRLNWSEGAITTEQTGPVRVRPLASQTGMEDGSAPMTSSTATRKSLTSVLFTLEGLELSLNEDFQAAGVSDLARLVMGKISGSASLHGDGETKVTVALEALQIINTKPSSSHVEKNIIFYDKSAVTRDDDKERPLVSVIYKISGDGNTKADVMMEKIKANIQIPYMLELTKFFTTAFTSPVPMETMPDGPAAPLPVLVGGEEEGPVMTLYFSIKQPELVLLADPENQNSRIVVLNADISFEYTANIVQQKMVSKISSLKMFSSIYGAPSDHQSKMLSPCDLEFSRLYNVPDNKLDMSASMNKMYVHFTPPNLRLLLDLTEILQQAGTTDVDSAVDGTKGVEPRDMWKIQGVTPEKWIDKYIEGESIAPVLGPFEVPIETLSIDVQEVCAFFEVENLDQTVPLLCARTSVEAKITNWTKQLRVSADLELDVCYYNEKLSVWEPLLEPNLVQEGTYHPWALRIQMFKAQSYPIVCSYDDNGIDMPDGFQGDVESLINRNQFVSSSSENEPDELDSPSEMTILRPKMPRRKIRIASDKSYESLSRHSSVQGESDSENESLIQTITSKLGSIFNSDSSEDADVSETDDNDDSIDWTLDKPIFLTPHGPVKFRAGPDGYDDVDGVVVGETDIRDDDDGGSVCSYVVFSSRDKLHLNITPPAIGAINSVMQALDKSRPDDLTDVHKSPAIEVHNKLGIDADVVVHKSIKVHNNFVHGCRMCHHGDVRMTVPPSVDDVIAEENEEEEDDVDGASLSSQRRPLTFVSQAIANAGHTLVSAGAFVFEDDLMVGTQIDKDGVQIMVQGFEPTNSLLMNRACRRLIQLAPKQNGTRYWMVFDIDMMHCHKSMTLQSPLQLRNHLTIPLDVFVKSSELRKYASVPSDADDFVRLATLFPGELYTIPLFPAFHCGLFIAPKDLQYENTTCPIWWPDIAQGNDKQKYINCTSTNGEKSFNIKVVREEGETLRPPQMVSRTIPYLTVNLHPPVVLHNHLPYDLQFSLEEKATPLSLTHGESTPLYTVNMNQTYKLNLYVSDYLTCDWRGTLDITREMEEFKAVTMDTDLDPDNNNKHLSLSVRCSLDRTWDLYIYSPYWIVNKTDLVFQIRGSMSDVILECQPASHPQLFRYKKHKRKKAKLRVNDAQWSHAFSLDTIGNCGVVECHDNTRHRKYRFMVQCQMSKLKLTKIITVLPFFLVVNNHSKPLRYMEENKHTDLWLDLPVNQCIPFWPVTESYTMFIKYENSNIVSQHFSFRNPHDTVLRMDNGSAVCVNVSGGTQTPITIQFTPYDVGDAPVRVENLCDDVFIKIHQKNQSQTTVLSSNQSVLYTWDDPVCERTLMWNVYGRNSRDYPANIAKDGYDYVTLKLKSLKSKGTMDYVDTPDLQADSSPEDESDDFDGPVDTMDASLLGKTRSDKLIIFWVSYLDNQQRVLLFTQDERVAKGARKAHVQSIDIPHERGVSKMNEAEQAHFVMFLSLDGVCVSMMNRNYEEVALLSVTSPPATWEVEVNTRWKILNVELQTWLEDQWRNQQSHASLQQQFEADLSKMQMLKPYMGALRRNYNPGMWLNFRKSRHHVSLHARIQRIQLDNQLPDAYFPTVLYPCPIPVYILRKKGQKPFMEFGMMRRTVPENNVDTFRYVKFLVQEFNIKIDKGFILSLYDVFAHLLPESSSESSQLQSDLMFTQKSLQEVSMVMVHSNKDKMYFEFLKLSPLKFNVSFSLNGAAHMSQENRPTIVSDVVDFFLGSVGATFTEMKDVQLKMAYLEVTGQSLSWLQLSGLIQAHYTHQFIQQAYVLILGLDVLGNPFGLIRDFTQGFGDLFYEPFLDTVQGSDEFSESLMRGVQSMLGNTVGGTAGSIARVTGSVGSALAALSLDKNYKIKRRAAMQQRPSNLPLSLALAGRGFVMGVCLGLSGVILDPVRGAQEEGVEGFFKGIGKGIMGLLTKPTGGVFDMVSMAFDGMQRAAELEASVVHRMRKPRFINMYMGLRPYSVYQAVGANLLLNVNKGQYAGTDTYWAHAQLSPGDRADVLLITTRHILLLQRHRCWGGWDVEWEVKLESIMGVPAVTGTRLIIKVKQDEHSMNVFAGGEQEISCDDSDLLLWLQQRIENLLRYRQR
ncbi:intermembrane lipid transfer protein VPS13A-like isoform X2 [Dreissena polymorpha]|uniref:intermembrane lipid transfer protein VPS13A-like isoform X2 n=1 Tax=Dreissena polymorpha TaxID=45954 RepID=UPI002263E814|nr:intermembrane lipid transfer protein VPS13A-like isoform X2 [Dreissena polymorpha]